MSKKSNNPVVIGLTKPEFAVYEILKERQKNGYITTSGDISRKWGKDRSHTYRVLRVLIEMDLVENYNSIYYRLKD